jgi:multiple sugar transport system ATP-binding protein
MDFAMASIELRNVAKSYGNTPVIRNSTLEIADGEFVALIGPSGCGKSTLLRMVAGLEDITSGEILIGGKSVGESSPRDRNIAMVFQSYALYPHMTVAENMGFNLKIGGRPKAEIKERVSDAARMLNLTELLDRRPAHLSGGQRQRVAMGRAVVRNPAAFLFDEPLSNLDAKLRVQMRAEIKMLHQRLSTTSVYVTHDQVEAMTLADRVVVLNKGKIEQHGSPLELYSDPSNRFVAEFIGSPQMNFLEAEVILINGQFFAKTSNDTVMAFGARRHVHSGDRIVVGLRPEHLLSEPAEFSLTGTIELVEATGAQTYVRFAMGEASVTATVAGGKTYKVGDRFAGSYDPNSVFLFAPGSGERIR